MSEQVAHRIDRVPPALRLPVELYGVAGAVVIEGVLRSAGVLVRMEHEGLEERLALGAAIECCWHRHVFSYFAGASGRLPKAAFFHPALYLKPFQVLGRWHGWRIAMGSAGNDGRAAADRMAADLREGYSAFVFPDGPAGPSRKLKPGVLHIARQSGRPIVPIRFEYTRAVSFPSWDSKQIPLPGGVVRQRYGPPIRVKGDLDAAAAELAAALGD